MHRVGFDNEKYLAEQTRAILERVEEARGKLYLEFGGKLTSDLHAARVLPGYDPDVKMRLLQGLRDRAEVIFCVRAADIEQGRVRGDFGITWDLATLKALDDLRDWDLPVTALVVTRYQPGRATDRLIWQVEGKGIRCYKHVDIPDYPNDVDRIVSDDGYGRNEYIETQAPLVVVTGPGPGSGKLSTCLSQMYHDHRRGLSSGYAKFETFPIWNLPVDHPVNMAYEAATADLGDIVMIDPFHLQAYGVTAANYNRDIQAFPILKTIIDRILGTGGQTFAPRSPTDMGVNRAAAGIIDDAAVCEASRQEVIRRYFRHFWEYKRGLCSRQVLERAEMIMARLGLQPTDRSVVQPARDAAERARQVGAGNEGFFCGAALELPDGTIVTGKNSPLFHSASACIINGIKRLAGLPDNIHLLPTSVVESVTELKRTYLDSNSPSLNVQELLVALGISAATNPAAAAGVEMLPRLRGCDMHLTHVPGPGDEVGLRKLGILFTTDANPTSRGYFLR
ncbi:MAG: DUF1846 domain-containing protein [Armatimonadetes bacterium]|nr:DUF1846 domain-containing protein [Armatimonadota bacterium]